MFEILFEIILSVLGIIVGVYGVKFFLDKRKKEDRISKEIHISQRLMWIYISTLTIVCIVFIIVFQKIYADTSLLQQVKLVVLILFLFPTALVDYKVKLIPNIFILCVLLIRCVIYIPEFLVSPVEAWVTVKDNLVAAVMIAGFFLIILLIFKNSIGMGDVKLFAIMGLYQGIWGALNAVFYSLIVSFFLSIILLVSKRVTRKDSISFAPSILLGTIISIIFTGC